MSAPWIAAVVVLWILAIALAIVVTGLLRRIAPVLERAEGSLAALPAHLQPDPFAVLGVDVIVDEDASVKQAFRSNAAPHAFAISKNGIVMANGTPNTFDGLRLLAHKLRRGGENTAEPRIAASI